MPHVNAFIVLLLNFLLVLVETLMVFCGCDMDKQSGQLAVKRHSKGDRILSSYNPVHVNMVI